MPTEEVLGNLQLFLVQMLVLFVGAQALTETLKQTWFKAKLVDAKLRPEQLLAEPEKKKELEAKEQERQAKVHRLAWASGAVVAVFAQINPLQTLSSTTVWDAVGAFMTQHGYPELLTRISVDVAYVLNFALVGLLAVYGAPLFNDLLNIVTSLRTNVASVKKAGVSKPGEFNQNTEDMLTVSFISSTQPPISEAEARAKAKAILQVAGTSNKP